jgi:hypothetical protein
MNTAINRVQNNVRAAIEKFINHAEESEMKLTTKNTERSNRFNGHISMKTPAKLLAGLALGVMLTWAGVSSYSAFADEPKAPLVTTQQLTIQSEVQDRFVQPSNTFTAEELLVIQAEMEDAYVHPRNTFTAEELLVIQAEMEDGFNGVVTHPAKQVEMSHAGGDRSVLQALQSHDVGSVFSAEEWLLIIAEIEDAV